jgi:preprotein translocase subunit SecF
MNIIKHRAVWFAFSGALIAVSVFLLGAYGLKQGIDFTGGTQIEVRFDQRPRPVEAERALAELDLGDMTIQPIGETDMGFRLKSLDGSGHQRVLEALRGSFGQVTELQYTAVGPAIGKELREKSVQALAIMFVAILAFIAWQFRKVSTPVKSWKYGVIVVLTAFHDVIVPLGLFALLGKLRGVEVGTPFIAAILTIMGYSINDTIVVFDRIRENLHKVGGAFEEVVERSLRQTMLRSFYTSVTTLLTLFAVYLFGGESIKDFALALIVGLATGTYSSIFIASPLLVTWYRYDQGRR